jgi:hypothetical protein
VLLLSNRCLRRRASPLEQSVMDVDEAGGPSSVRLASELGSCLLHGGEHRRRAAWRGAACLAALNKARREWQRHVGAVRAAAERLRLIECAGYLVCRRGRVLCKHAWGG